MRRLSFLVATVGLVLVACAKERALDTNTATTAAPTEPVAYADSRISRVAALIGKTKQEVVQTLGTPTDPGYGGRSSDTRKATGRRSSHSTIRSVSRVSSDHRPAALLRP
jgi:hypothetical protein